MSSANGTGSERGFVMSEVNESLETRKCSTSLIVLAFFLGTQSSSTSLNLVQAFYFE